GEIRLGDPQDEPDVLVASRSLWWPDVDIGRAGQTVPVSLVNTSAADIDVAGVSVSGIDRDDFTVRSDECTGVTVGPGEVCQVWMRFRPAVPGPRIAELAIDHGVGKKRAVAKLDGYGVPGLTQLVMHSDAGDYIGNGQDWSYMPA